MKVKTPEYVEISSDSDLYIKRDIDGTSLVVGVHDFEIPDPLTLHNGLISEDNPSRFSAGLYATEITLGDVEKGYLTSDRTSTKLCYQGGYSVEVKSTGVNIRNAASTALLSVGSYPDSAYLDVNCPIRPNSYFTTIKTPDISGKEDSGKIEFTFDDAPQVGVIKFYLYRDTSNTYSLVGFFSDDGFFTDSIQSSLIGTLENRVSDIYVNTIHALNYDGLPSGQVSTVDRLIVDGSTKLQAYSNNIGVYSDLVPSVNHSLGVFGNYWSEGYIRKVNTEKIEFESGATQVDLFVDQTLTYDLLLKGNFLPSVSSTYSLGENSLYWSNGYIHDLYSYTLTLKENGGSSNVTFSCSSGSFVSSGSLNPDQDAILDLGTQTRSWGTLYVKNLGLSTRLAIANMLSGSDIGSLRLFLLYDSSSTSKFRGDEISNLYIDEFRFGTLTDPGQTPSVYVDSSYTHTYLSGTWRVLNNYGGGFSYYIVLAIRIA